MAHTPKLAAARGTRPQVFIIESLVLEDEKDHREGEIIYPILQMSGKQPEYHYIRTKREPKHFVEMFGKSKFRYLHLSCHGNKNLFATTFDNLDDDEFS